MATRKTVQRLFELWAAWANGPGELGILMNVEGIVNP
jgi:hypothetical protein